jgi:cyclic di-GMP phosphodiesterase
MPRRPILVVDDEPSNLALLRQILQDDFPLVLVSGGETALATAAKHRPALMLRDVQMPVRDGYEVCRRLKANPATEAIPVIFATSLAEAGDEATGFGVGGVGYITKPLSAPVVRARVRSHLSLVRGSELEKSHRAAVHMLGEAAHYNDTDTGVHIWRMAAYARALAEAIGWPADDVAMIELAAPMHETGKIGVSGAILRKPGRLTAAEWAVMKTHCQIGHQILSKCDSPVFRLAAEIALHHHEKWDGGGYPGGLRGTAIPESARIAAVADVFDALSMRRLYKEAWPLERTLATLKEGYGRHFEAWLIEAFCDIQPTILQLKAYCDEREGREMSNRVEP